jgi:hypothetical protein
VFDALSQVPGATKARETLARTALAYLEALAAMHDAPQDVLAEAGRGFVRLAEVTGGGQSASLGRYADANALLARADELLAPAYAANPGDRATAEAFATLRLEQAGTNIYNNNDPDTARAPAEAAERASAPFARTSPEAVRLHATAIQARADSTAGTTTMPPPARCTSAPRPSLPPSHPRSWPTRAFAAPAAPTCACWGKRTTSWRRLPRKRRCSRRPSR